MREDALVEALDHVIATRVFGRDRHTYLRTGLANLPHRHHDANARRRALLQTQIEDLTARQDRLIAELEGTDANDRAFRGRLRHRFDTLETECATKTAELHDLQRAAKQKPVQEVGLLDALPILEHVHITQAPERVQRKLYDALQLQVHFDRPDRARFRLVLTDDTGRNLAAASEPAIDAHSAATPPGVPGQTLDHQSLLHFRGLHAHCVPDGLATFARLASRC